MSDYYVQTLHGSVKLSTGTKYEIALCDPTAYDPMAVDEFVVGTLRRVDYFSNDVEVSTALYFDSAEGTHRILSNVIVRVSLPVEIHRRPLSFVEPLEITDEMVEAFGKAWHEMDAAVPNGQWLKQPGARRRAGIRAVFDILQRPS